jgi:flagellar biosynthesis/type III secretory pathway protein FliH
MNKNIFKTILVLLIILLAFQAGKGDEFDSRSLKKSVQGQTENQCTDSNGDFLQRPETMNGAPESAAILDEEVRDLKRRLEELKRQLDRQSKGLRTFFKEEDIKRFEEEFLNVKERMKELGRILADMVEKQFLPQMEKEMERFKERLREFHRKERSEPEILEI